MSACRETGGTPVNRSRSTVRGGGSSPASVSIKVCHRRFTITDSVKKKVPKETKKKIVWGETVKALGLEKKTKHKHRRVILDRSSSVEKGPPQRPKPFFGQFSEDIANRIDKLNEEASRSQNEQVSDVDLELDDPCIFLVGGLKVSEIATVHKVLRMGGNVFDQCFYKRYIEAKLEEAKDGYWGKIPITAFIEDICVANQVKGFIDELLLKAVEDDIPPGEIWFKPCA